MRLAIPATTTTLLLRGLCAIGILGCFIAAHIPQHLATAAARLIDQPIGLPNSSTALLAPFNSLFWLPPIILLLALIIRNQGAALPAERSLLTRADVGLALLAVGVAGAIRLAPLLDDPWIKPNYDEGVYLGAAWLLRSGALPYRDVVFPHLPGAVFALLPSAALIAPEQPNLAALFAARATAIACDASAAGLIYLAARQLVDRSGAIFAALIYTSDLLVIEFARGVRLEPLQAPWLALGGLLVLATLNGRRLAGAAGLCLAFGIGIKITGGIVALAAASVFLIERRWRALFALLGGCAVGLLVICGWLLITAGDELIRQTILLQLSRPADSNAGRWAFLLGDQRTALTAVALFGGTVALSARVWRRQVASGWLFLCLWLGLTLLLFAYGSSFYDHYYTKLALPAALLASALPGALQAVRWKARPILIGLIACLLAVLWWGQAQAWGQARRAPLELREVEQVLALPTTARVLDLVPLHNVIAGRPFARPLDGPYILDTFLGTLYLESPLNRRWPDATTTMRAAIQQADFVIADPWTEPLPGVQEGFTTSWLVPESSLRLLSRVDQPSEMIQVGSDLQLLRRTPARIETTDGQIWLVQPLHWRAAATPPDDYALALHVVDRQGARVAQLDVPLHGGTTWQPGHVTTIEYRIPLPAALPSGTYDVRAMVYTWSTGERLPLREATSDRVKDAVDLLPVVKQ